MGKSKIIIITLLFLFSSCGEKKTEFIESNTMDLILIKNIPNDRTALRKQIKEFIINEKIEKSVDFYEYTYNSRYFIDNEESSGFGAEVLSVYQDESGIGAFYYEPCKNDTLQKVGFLRYYKKYGDFYDPDTIIGKCNKWYLGYGGYFKSIKILFG